MGKHYRFQNYEFWACDGMIAILDLEKAGSTEESVAAATKWLRPGEFLKNAIGARMMLDLTDPWEGRRMLEAAQACVKEAIKQGNIFDPKSFEQMVEDRRKVQVSTVNLNMPRRPTRQQIANLRYKYLQPDKVKDVLIEGIDKHL